MTIDTSELDRKNREMWHRAAAGWGKWQAPLREATNPVSRWMVDAIDPKPGQRVLELAAGPGETGFLAAPRIGPRGTLISSDQSPEMVSVARARAQELGLENVDFEVLDGQRIELESASVDAVLCRWGFMLMADAGAALRETHRVLGPAGRLALATWDAPEKNLWARAPAAQLIARGALPVPDPDAPGMFSMADPAALAHRLAEAGFEQIETERLGFSQSYASFEQYWEATCDLAAPIAQALGTLDAGAAAEVREGARSVLNRFTTPEGGLEIPASAVVAAARTPAEGT